MVIGTNSRSTLFDVFHTGVRAVIKDLGVPEEVRFTTAHCTLLARANDMSKKVDQIRIEFHLKDSADPTQMKLAVEATKIPHHMAISDGQCLLTLPAFEWRQMPQLLPIDGIVEKFSVRSCRSCSWQVSVEKFRTFGVNINVLIEEMQARKASDIHLRAGSPPYMRVDGDLFPLDMPVLSAEDMREIIFHLGGDEELNRLMSDREISFQYHLAGVCYLRCSGYIKMGAMALAIRYIPEEPVPFEKLDLPETVRSVADAHRGLFLVCGITGSGKSTTLAAMLDYINSTRHAHIISIEDPIEFVYRDKKSVISQRQVGRDTYSFANALRGALREDPDIILVGEMRDMDTIRAAISAAETGHLVFSTLHTMTAVDTVNRIISYFPQAERDLIRQELAYTLRGVACQRLLKRKGGGRVPCVEVLLGGKPIVRDAILEGDIGRLYSIIEVDSDMRSFDQYAVELYQKGIVDRDQAISACSDEEAFTRVTSGIKSSEGRKLLG
ncbi:MAG TPA: PilT/PilU family type 4a pilus ATPase [Candidatus Hydrogenedentes bacterium]|nr:PilT/PilU family type 4a pilus ATPase [Candidatus Hydrogenedentota bacterium]